MCVYHLKVPLQYLIHYLHSHEVCSVCVVDQHVGEIKVIQPETDCHWPCHPTFSGVCWYGPRGESSELDTLSIATVSGAGHRVSFLVSRESRDPCPQSRGHKTSVPPLGRTSLIIRLVWTMSPEPTSLKPLMIYYNRIKKDTSQGKKNVTDEHKSQWKTKINTQYYSFSLLQRIKRKLVGEEGRCRCYERQRTKSWGNWILSHTRWNCHTHLDSSVSRTNRCTYVHAWARRGGTGRVWPQ